MEQEKMSMNLLIFKRHNQLINKSLLLLICSAFLSFSSLFSQAENYVRPGLIRTFLTISPSYMFSQKQSYFYFHGMLEGYLKSNISLSGENYFYLGNTNGNSPFSFNHNLFCGANKHFTKKNNDFYLGIHPGISITKLNKERNALAESHIGINPLFSTNVGYNIYVYKFFHFFVQGRWMIGQHLKDIPVNLSEFRFSAGLGFNLNTIKQ